MDIKTLINEIWDNIYENIANFEDLSDNDIIEIRDLINQRLNSAIQSLNKLADKLNIEVGVN